MSNDFLHPTPEQAAAQRAAMHAARRQDVDLYVRTYNTLLRSSAQVKLKALVQAHFNMRSNLHPRASDPDLDVAALFYCSQRLPAEIARAKHIIMGQSTSVFEHHGIGDVPSWSHVTAPGRRRTWYYSHDHKTLAILIGSPSDVDDVVPTIVAYQIEWNKMTALLNQEPSSTPAIDEALHASPDLRQPLERLIQSRLGIRDDEWRRLATIVGDSFWPWLSTIARGEKDFTLRLLGGTNVGYARSARRWWVPIASSDRGRELAGAPVYVVSSNLHSLANLLSGFVLSRRDELEGYIEQSAEPELRDELARLRAGDVARSRENFLYYAARRYLLRPEGSRFLSERQASENAMGIELVRSTQGLDIDAQIIRLASIRPEQVDPRVRVEGMETLASSPAIILNIDYPLGLGAYFVFRQVVEHVDHVRGLYSLGKAATLNGSIGDVMISDAVYDEHSHNTFWLDNCFSARDVLPYLADGSVLDNQKAITVKGTFLQNDEYLDFYYRENFTVVEMEAGPYLDALYEALYPDRYPTGDQINCSRLPMDLGILHYASDTPFTSAHTLGARSLSYLGMDSTYAASVAIVRHVLHREIYRMRGAREKVLASSLVDTRITG